MLILEGKCPICIGNLVLEESDLSLTCEDCGYKEISNFHNIMSNTP